MMDFEQALSLAGNERLMRVEEVDLLYHLAEEHSILDGDFAECGVARGGSAVFIAAAIEDKNKELHLFDTFCGMPALQVSGLVERKPGCFANTSVEQVKEFLGKFPFVQCHEGLIPDTFREVEDKQFVFVHLDVDLYRSTIDSLNFFYPRLVNRGLIIIHDFNCEGNQGIDLAVNEFFRHYQGYAFRSIKHQALITKES